MALIPKFAARPPSQIKHNISALSRIKWDYALKTKIRFPNPQILFKLDSVFLPRDSGK